MIPNTRLSNKINEVYSDFILFYPVRQRYREEILELTINRILRSIADMSLDTLDSYLIGQQFRVDVTIELIKIAELMRSRPDINSARPQNRRVIPVSSVFYNRFEKIVYSR